MNNRASQSEQPHPIQAGSLPWADLPDHGDNFPKNTKQETCPWSRNKQCLIFTDYKCTKKNTTSSAVFWRIQIFPLFSASLTTSAVFKVQRYSFIEADSVERKAQSKSMPIRLAALCSCLLCSEVQSIYNWQSIQTDYGLWNKGLDEKWVSLLALEHDAPRLAGRWSHSRTRPEDTLCVLPCLNWELLGELSSAGEEENQTNSYSKPLIVFLFHCLQYLLHTTQTFPAELSSCHPLTALSTSSRLIEQTGQLQPPPNIFNTCLETVPTEYKHWRECYAVTNSHLTELKQTPEAHHRQWFIPSGSSQVNWVCSGFF